MVERTFAWPGRYRRLSKDYEFHTSTSEAIILFSMTNLMPIADWQRGFFRHTLRDLLNGERIVDSEEKDVYF